MCFLFSTYVLLKSDIGVQEPRIKAQKSRINIQILIRYRHFGSHCLSIYSTRKVSPALEKIDQLTETLKILKYVNTFALSPFCLNLVPATEPR